MAGGCSPATSSRPRSSASAPCGTRSGIAAARRNECTSGDELPKSTIARRVRKERRTLEAIYISLGDNPPNPLTGEQISDGHKHFRLCEQAAAAERAGFDVFQLGEHHFNDF